MSSDAVGAMTEETDATQGLVPKLRFPEFRGAGAWVPTPFDKVLLPISREVEKPGSSYTGLGLRSHGKGTFRKPEENPEKNGMDRLYVVHRDDLIVNITFAWEGAIAIAGQDDHGCYVSHRFPTYKFQRRVSSPEFFRYVITDKALVYQLGVISPGGAGRNRVLNKNDFLRLSTLLPVPNEQQKIANCLSSLDELIVAEEERVAAMRDYKNGLMQQLFPRPERIVNGEKIPAETTPRLRFPEFQSAGDWEDRPLGDLLECPPAYGVNAAAVPYDERLPTYLRITDISEDGRFVGADKTSVNVVATESNSMQPDDIALTRTGASVGKAYLHTTANGPLVFAGFLIRVRPDQRRALSQVVFQYMQTQAYWSWVLKTSARSGQPGLNSAEYSALRIPLPPDGPDGLLREQRQIANFLSSIDDLVVALTDRIAALKAHKTGLMQQLFPSPAEASA